MGTYRWTFGTDFDLKLEKKDELAPVDVEVRGDWSLRIKKAVKMAKMRRTIRFVFEGVVWSEKPDIVVRIDRRDGVMGVVDIKGLDTVERM